MKVSRVKIRKQVEAILQKHGIRRPPVDVHALALKLGIRVQLAPTKDDLSGFLLRDPSTGQTVIGVNSTHNRARQRFTIAHELGHFHLHRDQAEALHVDHRGSGFEIHARDSRSKDGSDPKEVEANAFAGELLMPTIFLDEDALREGAVDITDEKGVKRLADRYQVSTTAMSIRLTSQRYINILAR